MSDPSCMSYRAGPVRAPARVRGGAHLRPARRPGAAPRRSRPKLVEAPGFRAAVRHAPDAVEVAYFGELDRAVIREAEQALRAAMAGDATVVVDLSGLSFMDASGLRMLLAAHARLRDRLVLLRACPSVHRLFEVTGTAGCLPFAD